MIPHHSVYIELVVPFPFEDFGLEGCPMNFSRRGAHSGETKVDDRSYHSGAVVIHGRADRTPFRNA